MPCPGIQRRIPGRDQFSEEKVFPVFNLHTETNLLSRVCYFLSKAIDSLVTVRPEFKPEFTKNLAGTDDKATKWRKWTRALFTVSTSYAIHNLVQLKTLILHYKVFKQAYLANRAKHRQRSMNGKLAFIDALESDYLSDAISVIIKLVTNLKDSHLSVSQIRLDYLAITFQLDLAAQSLKQLCRPFVHYLERWEYLPKKILYQHISDYKLLMGDSNDLIRDHLAEPFCFVRIGVNDFHTVELDQSSLH